MLPTNPNYNAILAQEPEKVIAFSHLAIKSDPKNLNSYLLWAKALEIKGSDQASDKAYQWVEDRNPNLLSLHDRLSWANALANENRLAEASDQYQQALSGREIVLFFSPDTGVFPHFAAQCVLGKILQEQGLDVVFLPCGYIYHPFSLPSLEHASAWFNSNLSQEHSQQYRQVSRQALTRYGLPSLDWRVFWTQEMSQKVAQLLTTVPKDLREFKYNEISFGKLALFDLALTSKQYEFSNPSETLKTVWLKFIEHNLITYFLLQKIYSSFKIHSGLHFNDYSPMLTHRLVGENHDASIYSITQASHLNLDRRRYAIVPKTFRQTAFEQESNWPRFKGIPLPVSTIHQIGSDILLRFSGKGSHVYSPAKALSQPQIFQDLQLTSNRRLLVAYTSSRDEVVASNAGMEGLGIQLPSKQQPFTDQIEWLQSLVNFVESSNDLQLVVRIHPRESRNKRDSQVSQHLSLLLKNFDKNFKHCRFVWPEDPLSSYDLGEMADLVLTSWSSMGLEFARLGVPVLTSTSGISPFPHDDFLEWGETPELYFQKLLQLLERTPSLETIIKAFRWYNLFHLGTSVDLSDVIPSSDFTGLPVLDGKLPVKESEKIHNIISSKEHILDISHEQLGKAQDSEAFLKEKEAVLKQIHRMIHFTFTGNDAPREGDLSILTDVASPEAFFSLSESKSKFTDILAMHGSTVFYSTSEDGVMQRQSKLCARLAHMVLHNDVVFALSSPLEWARR